jgi:hypothetical protein
MKQNKIPRNEYIIKPKGKTNPYKHDVVYSNLGQWKYPGQVTKIPSNQITMQGVNYPVQGIDDTGYSQMMYPGMDYTFPGESVTEYPMAQKGRQVEDNDSWLENVGEIIDPTGISSWDDVYRAYKNTGLSKETALEAFGAIPLLGKISKVTEPGIHLIKYSGIDKILRNTLPRNKSLSRAANVASKTGRGTDAVQALLGAKDNSGFTWDLRHGEVPKYGGRNIFPQVDLGEHGDYAYGGSSDIYPFGGIHTKTDTHMATGGWLDELPEAQLGKIIKEGLKDIKSLPKPVINKKYTLPSKEKIKDLHGFIPRRQFVKEIQKEGLIGKDFKDLNYAASSTDKTNALTKLALERKHTGFRNVTGEIPKGGISNQASTGKLYNMNVPAHGQKISEMDNMKKAGVDLSNPESISKYQATHIPLEDYGYRSTGEHPTPKYGFLFRSPEPSASTSYGNYQYKSLPNLDFSSGNYKDWFNKYHNNSKYHVKDNIYGPERTEDLTEIMPWKKKNSETLVGPRGSKAFEIDEAFPFSNMKNLTPEQIKNLADYRNNFRNDYNTGWKGKYKKGGWLDSYQDGGKKIDMSKVKMDYFPKSNVEAQSRLDEEKAWENAYYKQQDKDYQNEVNAAVKKGIPRKQAEVVIKKYKSEPQEQSTVVAHTPQSKISKALEVATNPVLAMKNYKGHRLPDNFSSNAEEDLFSPSSVSNLGYQFLSLPGKMAFATSSGDEAVKNVKDKDYLMAGVNAAFSAPVFSPLKGLNKLKKSGTLNKASKLLNAAPENNFTYKGVIEPFKGSTALTKEEANAYYDFLKERQNPYLAGQWKNEYKEFKKQYPVTSKSSTGIIEKPSDPEYYKNFLVNGKSIPKNKKGGQKGLKSFTSKNVFSSINDIMLRNEKVFGPAGKRRFKPGLKYKDGGWLDNLLD